MNASKCGVENRDREVSEESGRRSDIQISSSVVESGALAMSSRKGGFGNPV